MSEYNLYVKTINIIFENLEKMKNGWKSIDNLNYIESIEEYKKVISKNSDLFKNQNLNKIEVLEELGND